jgi:ribosome biogenesis GTPase
VRQDRGACRVATDAGVVLARPSGRLQHEARLEAAHGPVVGDWVAVTAAPGGSLARVHAVLPRASLLVRREAGGAPQGQALAANVDVVLVVAALDAPLRLRRLERSLALAAACGASGALVLTKADLCADLPRAVRDAESLGAPVALVAGAEAAGLAQVRALLPPAATGVLLGPSGAGKSTLVNHLLGEARLATGEVREADRKGRHTTVRRELVPLPHGALLVDGPGTRELGLWVGDAEAGDTLGATFEDLEALAQGCRFGDCTHAREPGCAVRAALEAGALEEGRLESWRKLQRELAYAVRQADPEAARAHAQRVRRLTAQGWARSRHKRF